MTLLIIAIICLAICCWLIRSLEIKEHYNSWVPLKLPLWGWICLVIGCLIPIINIVGVICFVVISIAETNSSYPDIRFKEHKCLDKIIEFFNKKY